MNSVRDFFVRAGEGQGGQVVYSYTIKYFIVQA
jgi:hypothetical protein